MAYLSFGSLVRETTRDEPPALANSRVPTSAQTVVSHEHLGTLLDRHVSSPFRKPRCCAGGSSEESINLSNT